MFHALVCAVSAPSTEMHRFRPFRNLAFYFIDFRPFNSERQNEFKYKLFPRVLWQSDFAWYL